MDLTPQDFQRYSRHLNLTEIGAAGQEKLKSARVLIIGLGGLGCPAAMYLAGAGIGKLGLVDSDQIETSNLQRQPLYASSNVGKFKAEVAAKTLQSYNPLIEIEAYPIAINELNALSLIENYDIVIDATDNFKTRYLINDACFFLKKLNVFASVTQFEGRLTTFSPDGPCYRCLYPEPPIDIILNCASEGILGSVPGFWGTLQATEALKLILNIGENAVGIMHVGDLLNFSLKRLIIKKHPSCPLCSSEATIKKLSSLSTICGSVSNLSCEELKNWLKIKKDFMLIDVREKEEFLSGTIEGAISLPLSQIVKLKSSDELPFLTKEKTAVLFCQSGQRSVKAGTLLSSLGFNDLFTLIDCKNHFIVPK